MELVLVFLSLLVSYAGGMDICSASSSGVEFCGDGYHCCHNDTLCCADLTVGVIVGIVIGCLFLLAMGVSCIACLCNYGKNRASVGQVVTSTPNTGAQVHMISTGYYGYGQPAGYAQPVPGPPAYHQQGQGPPGYDQQGQGPPGYDQQEAPRPESEKHA